MLPVTALAAETNTVYVGGVALAGSSDSIIYATTNENGEVITNDADANNYNIKWDGSTLTLRGATIKKELNADKDPLINITGAAIGVLNQYGDAELTITLEGTNTIEDVSVAIYMYAPSTGRANLTITGDGSLDVSASSTGIRIQSYSGDAAVSIENAKVTATAKWGSGVHVRCNTNSSASLTVNGGNLTSSGSPGILYDTFASSIPSTIEFIVSNSALVDARGGGIGAGSLLEGLEEVSPADDSVGIVFGHDRSDSKAGTVYGDVTLDESLTINEGETLTVPDGSSLNCNDNLTNNGTIIVEKGGNLTGNPGGKVVYAPAITNHPQDVEVKENETATFTVEATGTDLSYQWQQNMNGSGWTDITGETNATYTTGKTTMDMNGTQYRCVVKNSIDEVTSDAALLTVKHNLVKTEYKAPTCTGMETKNTGLATPAVNISATPTVIPKSKRIPGLLAQSIMIGTMRFTHGAMTEAPVLLPVPAKTTALIRKHPRQR